MNDLSVTYSFDHSKLDMLVITTFLQGTHWGAGRKSDAIARSLDCSTCIGAYHFGSQIGFARAFSDGEFYAHLCDVFVLPAYRKQGIGRSLVTKLLEHPNLIAVKAWYLFTRDAHALYEKVGFRLIEEKRVMRLKRP